MKRNAGTTPLIAVAERGHGSMVQALLERPSIAPDSADLNGLMALIYMHSSEDTRLELLLKRQDSGMDSKYRSGSPSSSTIRA